MERFSQETVELVTKLSQEPGTDQTEANHTLFAALLNLGEAKRKLGHFEEAVAIRFQALDVATSQDNQLWRAHALHELGEMYADVKQQREAEDYLREALKLYEENNAQARVDAVQQILTEFSAERSSR